MPDAGHEDNDPKSAYPYAMGPLRDKDPKPLIRERNHFVYNPRDLDSVSAMIDA